MFYLPFFRMGSILRLRTRHLFGSGSNGMSLQHSYEISHMCAESGGEDETLIDNLMRKFYSLSLPAIECVEKLTFYFSRQFEYRIEWIVDPGRGVSLPF